MRILGRRKKNTILEVTPKEFDAIRVALYEWQGVEDQTTSPAREFEKVLRRIYKAIDKFESLPVVKDETKKLE
jgi:hypothetical protein